MQKILLILFIPFLSITIISCSTTKELSKSVMEKTCIHEKHVLRCAEYVGNYDGDTVTFNLYNVPPVFGDKMKVRIAGIDTPELRSRNACEKKLAQKAQKKLHELLKDSKRIDLLNPVRGKYFRVVASIIADDMDVSKVLIKENLAVPYSGKMKKKQNWCTFLKK